MPIWLGLYTILAFCAGGTVVCAIMATAIGHTFLAILSILLVLLAFYGMHQLHGIIKEDLR